MSAVYDDKLKRIDKNKFLMFFFILCRLDDTAGKIIYTVMFF